MLWVINRSGTYLQPPSRGRTGWAGMWSSCSCWLWVHRRNGPGFVDYSPGYDAARRPGPRHAGMYRSRSVRGDSWPGRPLSWGEGDSAGQDWGWNHSGQRGSRSVHGHPRCLLGSPSRLIGPYSGLVSHQSCIVTSRLTPGYHQARGTRKGSENKSSFFTHTSWSGLLERFTLMICSRQSQLPGPRAPRHA